jgi:hypothetical protein
MHHYIWSSYTNRGIIRINRNGMFMSKYDYHKTFSWVIMYKLKLISSKTLSWVRMYRLQLFSQASEWNTTCSKKNFVSLIDIYKPSRKMFGSNFSYKIHSHRSRKETNWSLYAEASMSRTKLIYNFLKSTVTETGPAKMVPWRYWSSAPSFTGCTVVKNSEGGMNNVVKLDTIYTQLEHSSR